MDIQGFIAPGFQRVAEAFEENFTVRGDVDAQCCVHVDGKLVADLWSGYGKDAIQVVFSATKGATAACANLLIQRGLLDLDAPVSHYWPEYSVNNKEKTLVRWLLTHKAGVLAPEPGLTMDDLDDWDKMVASLAAQPPPGNPELYMDTTRIPLDGWWANWFAEWTVVALVSSLTKRLLAQPELTSGLACRC